MCGIIGIVTTRPCADALIDGLSRLEYRGYDSAGIMVRDDDGSTEILKSKGRLWALREQVGERSPRGSLGIGHTRWATHGRPTDANAHPHRAGRITLVHNGIIDNFLELRRMLEEDGVVLASETDTEVLAHVVDRHVAAAGGDVGAGLRSALREARGSYALALWVDGDPDALWFARHESPLVIGLMDDGNIIASDPLALVAHTQRVIYLDDGVYGRLTRDGVAYWQVDDGAAVTPPEHRLTWQSGQADRGPYKHFMAKEIHEQPEVIRATLDHLLGRTEGGPRSGLEDLDAATAKAIRRVQLLACGTSLRAAEVARLYFARLAGVVASADQAGEWRSLGLTDDADTLTVAISQSGETADTLSALRLARTGGTRLAAVVNVPGSSIDRMVDVVLHTQAGPEVSVASTKAFTTQLVALYLLAARLGHLRGHLDDAAYAQALTDLDGAAAAIRTVLLRESRTRDLALKLSRFSHALFLGRGALYPIASEGALKLKEISYIHAEGYSAAEMKHGPIALIDERMATVMLVPRGPDYAKALGNLQEIKARDGFVIGFVTEGDERLAYHTDGIFPLPDVPELIQPIVAVVPLQLLAYHVADYRGTDIDKPRNLAKSVTVE